MRYFPIQLCCCLNTFQSDIPANNVRDPNCTALNLSATQISWQHLALARPIECKYHKDKKH